MIAVTSLLVLASAVAINALALNSACNNIQIGDVKGTPTPLEITYLTPNIADWEVSIPDVPGCPNGAAGVTALVCDSDVAPTGRFADKNLILVHRNGQLQGTASVQTTVYCANQWPSNKLWPSSSQLSPPLNQLWPSNNQLSSALNQVWPSSNKLWPTTKQPWSPNNEQLNSQPPLNAWNQPQQALVARPQ